PPPREAPDHCLLPVACCPLPVAFSGFPLMTLIPNRESLRAALLSRGVSHADALLDLVEPAVRLESVAASDAEIGVGQARAGGGGSVRGERATGNRQRATGNRQCPRPPVRRLTIACCRLPVARCLLLFP